MIERIYRGKQAYMVTLKDREYKRTIAHGSVRSGKTEAVVVGNMEFSRQWQGDLHMFVEPTVRQLNNIILPTIKWYCKGQYEYDASEKTLSAFGNKYLLISANDNKAVDKITGLTLRSAMLDELTKLPQNFVQESINRVSKPFGKVTACTNPEGPRHWVKKEWVDNPDVDALQFGLDDNPSLTLEYKQNLRKSLTGAFLRRSYYGEWVSSTGLVYPQFTEGNPPYFGDVHRWHIAVDVARSGITHALLIAEYTHPREDWVVDEWCYDGRTHGVLSPEEQVGRIQEALIGDKLITYGFCDKSAPDFMKVMNDMTAIPVYGGENDVLMGIQQTANGLESNFLKIGSKCNNLLEQMSMYEWDETFSEKGVDKPIKQYDHGPDALRYYTATINKIPTNKVRVVRR